MLRAFCFFIASIITQTDPLHTIITFEYDALDHCNLSGNVRKFDK
jgi:hypothetical protein